MRLTFAGFLFLFTTALFASPIITSVSPAEGPVAGGTVVTIHGSGFSTSATETTVWFEGNSAASATSVRVVDSSTITAVTPASLPGHAGLFVSQREGTTGQSAFLNDAFVFTGSATDAFDRLLLPLFLPPIYGAYGSQFLTYVSMWNAGQTDMVVYGAPQVPMCHLEPCLSTANTFLPSRPIAETTAFIPTGTAAAPGRFIYVGKGSSGLLAATLRVQDISRQAQTWGTQIPVVPDGDFRSSLTALIDVPYDVRFRNTLRIYGDRDGTVSVRIVQATPPAGTVTESTLPLTSGATIFDPSYASFSEFPPPLFIPSGVVARMRIEITPSAPLHIWAFVSATNNQTQHITVITPQ